jgi:hypothetical protein
MSELWNRRSGTLLSILLGDPQRGVDDELDVDGVDLLVAVQVAVVALEEA